MIYHTVVKYVLNTNTLCLPARRQFFINGAECSSPTSDDGAAFITNTDGVFPGTTLATSMK